MNVPLAITPLMAFQPLFRKIQLTQIAQDIVDKLIQLIIRKLVRKILRRYPSCIIPHSDVEESIMLIRSRSILGEEVVCLLNDYS